MGNLRGCKLQLITSKVWIQLSGVGFVYESNTIPSNRVIQFQVLSYSRTGRTKLCQFEKRSSWVSSVLLYIHEASFSISSASATRISIRLPDAPLETHPHLKPSPSHNTSISSPPPTSANLPPSIAASRSNYTNHQRSTHENRDNKLTKS